MRHRHPRTHYGQPPATPRSDPDKGCFRAEGPLNPRLDGDPEAVGVVGSEQTRRTCCCNSYMLRVATSHASIMSFSFCSCCILSSLAARQYRAKMTLTITTKIAASSSKMECIEWKQIEQLISGDTCSAPWTRAPPWTSIARTKTAISILVDTKVSV